MNKEQLDAIKERVENATPGEWGLGVYRVYNDKFKAVAETLRFEDAKFIAHARQDVPALIAEVERLQQFERKAIYAIEENRKLREALEFHLKVSSKALESEGEKADAFQRVLEKVYDELGGMYEKNQALTRHRMLEIVCDIESVLDGEPSLRDDDDE